MSRIIVFEIPDACTLSSRTLWNKLRELEATIELRVSMSFENWVELNGYDKSKSVDYLPAFPHYRTKECPNCKGVGKIYNFSPGEFSECKSCGGLGEVSDESKEEMISRYENLANFVTESNRTPIEKRKELYEKYPAKYNEKD